MQLRQNMNRRKYKIKPRVIIGTIAIALIIFIVVIFQIALSPAQRMQREYETLAQKNGLTNPTSILVSKRAKVYYSVFGQDKHNHKIIMVMQSKNKNFKPVILKQSDGLSEKQIRELINKQYQAKKVYSIALTIYEGVPAWDISFLNSDNNLSYATIQFSNGKQLKLIQNL